MLDILCILNYSNAADTVNFTGGENAMLFCNDTERQNAVAIGKLNYTNPFMPERLELEKEILGRSEALSL